MGGISKINGPGSAQFLNGTSIVLYLRYEQPKCLLSLFVFRENWADMFLIPGNDSLCSLFLI